MVHLAAKYLGPRREVFYIHHYGGRHVEIGFPQPRNIQCRFALVSNDNSHHLTQRKITSLYVNGAGDPIISTHVPPLAGHQVSPVVGSSSSLYVRRNNEAIEGGADQDIPTEGAKARASTVITEGGTGTRVEDHTIEEGAESESLAFFLILYVGAGALNLIEDLPGQGLLVSSKTSRLKLRKIQKRVKVSKREPKKKINQEANNKDDLLVGGG